MKAIKHLIQTLITGFIICCSAAHAQSISKVDAENRIRNFFAGFEKRDWNMVAGQVTDDFNFTSPNNDNHINLKQYKEKCWSGVKYFKHIVFSRIVVDGNTAFAMYDITSTDNKPVHNVEYYTFSNGKIKSIETFFGAGVGYPGSQKNFK